MPPLTPWRVFIALAGLLAVLVAMFVAWGPAFQHPEPDSPEPNAVAAAQEASGMARAAPEYLPRDLTAAPGVNNGEVTITWQTPTRPDVVASVVYEGTIHQGSGIGRARAVVTYNGSRVAPRTTLHGLPRAQRICLSVAHVVSVNGRVSNAVSQSVCAVPR
jgi:hypothetical protein